MPSGHRAQCPPARPNDQMSILRQFLWMWRGAILEGRVKEGHRSTTGEAILETKFSRNESLDKVEVHRERSKCFQAVEEVDGQDFMSGAGSGVTLVFCSAPPF